MGINATAAGIRTIYDNTIYSISGSGSVTGITNGTGATSSDVYNNKIYDLSSTTTSTATVYGISATTIQANLNIYNNLIGNLTASTANPGGTTDAIRGLSITGTTANTNVNISFNTIYINASSSGTNFSASGIYHTYNATGSTASLTMRNNIIYNNSTASGTGIISAFRRSAATDLNNYNTASNNNLFYAGTPSATNLIFYDGTSSYSVLASFKAVVTPREANSIRENPAFVSTTGSNVNFLHINTATPTLIESGGTTVTGITTDFDGNARNVATPDIGADEFAGTPAVAMVYASSDAVQQTGTAYPTTNQTILRMVVNTTGSASPLNISSFTLNANGITHIADVTTAKVYYTGASTVFDASVLFGTNTPTVANYTITGSQDLVEGSNYFWLVYDVTTTALNGNLVDAELVDLTVSSTVYTPSTSAPAGSKVIAAPLDGNYNVGAGQVSPNYTTVTAAINDLNARGVKNNVTFTLLNNTSTPYDAANGETFPIVINEISGASPTQTITIKPGAGVTSIISGSVNSNSLIKLSGSDYITIDGSNSGGNDRSLTITNTGTTTPTAVSIASLGTGLGAVNNTIKNCNLNTSATSTAYGVSVGGNPGVSGADNDNVTIQNNYINGVSRGIYAIGTAAGLLDNLQINQNTIDINTTTSTIGIQTGQATSSSVSNNTLTVETSTSTDPVGISIETGFVSSVINSNNIKKVKCTYAISQYGGRGITIGTASATSALTVANNSISGVSGVTNFSAFSYSSVGIFLGTIGASSTITTVAGGIDLYFNSVNMSGDFAGYNTAATLTAALYVGSNASALNVRDNVFVNSLNNLHGTYGATSKSYAIYSVAPLASYTTIDYNDYYVSGAQGVLGYIGSARADLPAIQAGFGSNAASITADPLFNTAIVLAPLSGSPLLSAGENPNTTGITTDLVNTARGATPTIGAYEAAGDVAGPEITYTALLNATSGANRTLAVTITDLSGIAGGANQPLIYYRKGNSGVYFSAPATTVVAPTYTFTIDHSNVGGLSSGEKIQYYVAAQDALANISTSPDGGSGATPPGTTAPSSPNEYAFPITYVWQGGSSDFQSAANWSPTRTSLDANDILVFDGAVTAAPTVSNIPSQTITKLRFINNVNATLDGAASASLTINGDAATDNLDIAAGSTATLGQTSSLGILFTNVGQQGNVAGTLAMHSGTINFTNATTTFTSTGVFSINGTAGQTSTATNLSFATGASVLFNKTSGTIPTATYDLNSNITVSGITTGTGLSWPASIGGLTWNCPAQTSNFSIASSVTTINGDINIINTNTGTFQTGVSVQTLNVNGNAALSGGTWNVSGNNLAMTGTFTQSGGTLIKTTTSAQNWSAASINQTAGTINGAAVAGLFTFTSTTGNTTLAGTVDGGTSGGTSFGFSGTGNQTFTTTGATLSNRIGLTVNKTSGNAILANSFTENAGAALILTSGTLDLNGNALTLNGTVSGTGTITGSATSSIVIGGTGSLGTLNFDQTTDGTTNVLNNLTMARTTSGAATLGNKTVVLGTVTLSDGTLTTGGNLHLRSTATGDARAAEITGTGAITGNATIERYIPASGNRAWRLVAAPVTAASAPTINAAWQEGGVAGTLGTHITQAGGAGTNGFDALAGAGATSLKYYDGTALQNVANTNVLKVSDNGGAYFLFVRGDRNITLTDPLANSNTTLRMTGALNTGNVNAVGVSGAAFSLIPNPYASPVDYDLLFAGNVGAPATFYVWDATLGTVGAYRSITRNGVADYTATPGGNDPNHRFIRSGQAVFVPGAFTFNYTESMKTAGLPAFNAYKVTTQGQELYTELSYNNGSTTILADAFRVKFDGSYSAGVVVGEDVPKMTNINENLGIKNSGSDLVIDKRPMATTTDTVFLKFWNTAIRNYTLTFAPSGFTNETANLIDNYTNTTTPINLTNGGTYAFSVSNATGSWDSSRFKIVFSGIGTLSANDIEASGIAKKEGVQVSWKVSKEQNTSHYEVERSADSRSFAKISSSNAKSNNGDAVMYSTLDATAIDGDNYYRIKAIATDGKYKYSNTIKVSTGDKASTTMNVFPNPVEDGNIHLQLSNLAAGNYTVKLYDVKGQMVFSTTIAHQGGSSNHSLNIGKELATGYYQMKLADAMGNQQMTQQVIIK